MNRQEKSPFTADFFLAYNKLSEKTKSVYSLFFVIVSSYNNENLN